MPPQSSGPPRGVGVVNIGLTSQWLTQDYGLLNYDACSFIKHAFTPGLFYSPTPSH
jgi:hypothetical protein